jgi:uncharacterized protein YbgA (DUF1722 family)/uncharacterized protein YbbK (DUF523 family)
MEEKIKLGISSCLLGNKVRYDGGHQMDHYLTDTLGCYVDYVPVCPEVECGLSIPREAMRLVGDPQYPRLITIKTKVDHTKRMNQWAKNRLKELGKENLCGFIFKKNSPSSGMERVKVYNEKGMPLKQGRGMFAKAFIDYFPRIPVEEDGRLHDPILRENFIERIFSMKRWRETLAGKKTVGDLVDFHTRHKLLILAHSPKHYRMMGKLVAAGKSMPVEKLYETYEAWFMEALKLKTTLKKNTNVLQHMMGYFKQNISYDEKQEFLEILKQYREGHVPLIVPVTLMNHYVRKYSQKYLSQQIYLKPHPTALKLRNHA